MLARKQYNVLDIKRNAKDVKLFHKMFAKYNFFKGAKYVSVVRTLAPLEPYFSVILLSEQHNFAYSF